MHLKIGWSSVFALIKTKVITIPSFWPSNEFCYYNQYVGKIVSINLLKSSAACSQLSRLLSPLNAFSLGHMLHTQVNNFVNQIIYFFPVRS